MLLCLQPPLACGCTLSANRNTVMHRVGEVCERLFAICDQSAHYLCIAHITTVTSHPFLGPSEGQFQLMERKSDHT